MVRPGAYLIVEHLGTEGWLLALDWQGYTPGPKWELGYTQRVGSWTLKWRYMTQHNDIKHNRIYNTTLTIMALSTMPEHCCAESHLC